MVNKDINPKIDDLISGDLKRFADMVDGGDVGLKTSRMASGRSVSDLNMPRTAELLSGQLAVHKQENAIAALSQLQETTFAALLDIDESEAGSSGGGGSDGPDRGPANNTSLPAGVKPVTTFGAMVAREILGFEGTIGGIGQRKGASDHPAGYAIDIMVGKNREQGNQVANFFYRNKETLKVKYIIWYEKWTSPSTNWKWVAYTRYKNSPKDDTLQHRDHPHISFLRTSASTKQDALYWPSGRRASWPGQSTQASGGAGIASPA